MSKNKQMVKKYFIGRKLRRNIAGYLFIAPAMMGFIVFMLIPTIASVVLSFFEWNIVKEPVYSGLNNYKEVIKDPLFWNSIKVTLQYIVYHIPASLILAFIMAIALKQKIRGVGVFRTAFVLPWITTPIIISFVWKWILDPNFGILNYFAKTLGFDMTSIINSEWFPMVSVALINMWIFCGYHMMIFTAGLGNIPSALYEAAMIDGANGLQRTFKITVPLMRPTIMFAMITSVIGSFQIFDLIYGMYQGGPGDATRVYYYYIYENAFSYFKMGYACTISVILFLLLLVFTLLQYFFFQRNMITDYSS